MPQSDLDRNQVVASVKTTVVQATVLTNQVTAVAKAQGVKGADGAMGPQGAQGIQGPQGPAGPTGPMGNGDVNGPGSSTDNAIARFDGTGGKTLQNSLVTVDDLGGITLAQQTTPAYSRGTLAYDTSNESLTFFNNDSDLALQIGQEEWIRGYNTTGVTIPNGSVVYISGSSAGMPTFALARADSAITGNAVGIATENIANGALGTVTGFGLINGLDTSAFTTGAIYLSATVAGALTQTIPVAPNFRYRVGFVTNVNATTGCIHVTPSTAILGFGTANQIVGMNAAATAQEVKTIQGTASQVTITNTANTITASLPATINVSTTGSAATLTTARTIGTLTGDITTAGSTFNGSANNTNATVLATVNANVGSFGSASSVMTQTVNAKGLTTAAASVAIQIAESQVTNLVTDLAAKQANITLTTTGSSGAATLVGATLNIPQYAGTTYTAGTGLTLAAGSFSVNASQNISTLSNLSTNGLVKTSGGTGALSIATAGTDYQAPITLTTTGSSGPATLISNTLNIPQYGGGGPATSITKAITQTSHGFAVGNLIRYNGTAYVKAQADSSANAEAVGIVSTVVGANDFVFTIDGPVTGLSGLTAGSAYFLDPATAGAYTATNPSTVGQVSKPMFVADSTTSILFHNYRGIVIAAAGAGDMVLANTQTNTGAKTFNSGTLIYAGATSGTTTVNASVVAGTTVLTLPAATDTLVGKATTDTLTNKTFNTAGTGNVFQINGTTISANTGTGSNVLATSPTLVTPTLGVATATTVNKVTITAPTTNATLTLVQGSSLITAGAFATTLTSTAATNVTLPTTGTLATLAGTETLSGKTLTAPRFASAGFIADANGNQLIAFPATVASAVNEIVVSNSASLSPPSIGVDGSDTNIALSLNPKGSGLLVKNGSIIIADASNSLTLTNKAIDGSTNTLTNIPGSALSTTAITLGYAEIQADQSSTTVGGQVDITGLSVTVTVPSGGRRIKITGWQNASNTSGNGMTIAIREGTTVFTSFSIPGTTLFPGAVMYSLVPTAGTHTYKLSMSQGAAGTMTFRAAATYPAFILVELI